VKILMMMISNQILMTGVGPNIVGTTESAIAGVICGQFGTAHL
jgi:Na+-transporting methylmalonyl-CoA/oxaloacetate decarboxylase beta subunit